MTHLPVITWIPLHRYIIGIDMANLYRIGSSRMWMAEHAAARGCKA